MNWRGGHPIDGRLVIAEQPGSTRSHSSAEATQPVIPSGSSRSSFMPNCCPFVTSFDRRRAYNPTWGVIGMFDVYVRGKSELLVIRRGAPLPAGLVGGWRKKRAARAVSDEISGAVMREGFYRRSHTALIDTPADVRAS
jgi:hypothetical protein